MQGLRPDFEGGSTRTQERRASNEVFQCSWSVEGATFFEDVWRDWVKKVSKPPDPCAHKLWGADDQWTGTAWSGTSGEPLEIARNVVLAGRSNSFRKVHGHDLLRAATAADGLWRGDMWNVSGWWKSRTPAQRR